MAGLDTIDPAYLCDLANPSGPANPSLPWGAGRGYGRVHD
jgi:hypothetical protein